MRIHQKLIVGSLMLAAMSGPALADSHIRFGLSIGVPSAPVYVAPAPGYYPAPVYSAPPPGYYAIPPQVYYTAPAPMYYDRAPGVSIYYGPSYRHYRERRDWRRDRYRDDDD
jgi:hypothetical protein